MSRRFLSTIAIIALLAMPGCSGTSGSGAGSAAYSGYGTPGSVAPSGGTSLAPGRTAKRGGRVEVVGTLQRDESGSWLVIGALPANASGGKVVGVIVNSGSLSKVDLPALEDSYVRVTGTAAQGAATDASGLGVIADTVTKLTTK